MTNNKKIAIFSAYEFEVPYLKKANKDKYELVFCNDNLSIENLCSAGELTAIAIFSRDEVNDKILAYLEENNIFFIATRSAGFNHIDLKAAEKRNIKISNVPEYSPQAIAEHSLGLMLALLRKLIPSYERIKQYNFSLDGLVGSEITGKTIGVLGVGAIGSALVKILSGFDCSIILYDVKEDKALNKNFDVAYVSVEKLLSASDIISVHLPLTKKTEFIIDKTALKKVKPTALLINAGRGKLIDTGAVVHALKNEKLGGFGMDVYEHEDRFFYEDHSNQVFKDDVFERLLTFKNVIVTAHQAFLTDTALTEIAGTTFRNMTNFVEKNNHINKVTN